MTTDTQIELSSKGTSIMCVCKRLFIITILLFAVQTGSAGAASYRWSRPFGDAADQIATSVAIDVSQNVIVTGDFTGTVDFGGGPLVCNGLASSMYLAKIDALGKHVWSRVLGDSLRYGTNMLAVDFNSNVLLANTFRGTVDFGGGPITAEGFRDGIVTKFDEHGNHIWSQRFGGDQSLVEVKAASVDPSGNLIVVGIFTGMIDFGEGQTLRADPYATNIFVANFHAMGGAQWVRQSTGEFIEITAVGVDAAGRSVITGYHNGNFDFGGGPVTADGMNIFLAKYDGTGNHVWSYSFGASGTIQRAFDVAVDLSGAVFVTGEFIDPLDFGGGDLISGGGWDIFLVKFNPAGNHVWSARYGDQFTQRAYTVAVDGEGNVLVGGHFSGSVNFGYETFLGDPVDFCVARFDPAGKHLWSDRFDVFNLGLPNDEEYSIAAAANVNGEIAFVGSFKDAVNCGGGSLAGGGGWDTFIAKYDTSPVTGIRPPTPVDLGLAAHPNPFNPRTTITYAVPSSGVAHLRLYDVEGRHVRTFVDGWTVAGEHLTTWDGRDSHGQVVASGVYFLRLDSAGHALTKRLVLLK
jgi:hypothetical protein